MVDLSCLIVIAALFSQITTTIPPSANPKAIDYFFFYQILKLSLVFIHHLLVLTITTHFKEKIDFNCLIPIVELRGEKNFWSHVWQHNYKGRYIYPLIYLFIKLTLLVHKCSTHYLCFSRKMLCVYAGIFNLHVRVQWHDTTTATLNL